MHSYTLNFGFSHDFVNSQSAGCFTGGQLAPPGQTLSLLFGF